MLYVPSTDGAWDVARVDEEVADLRRGWPGGPFEPADHHPFYQYFSGRTRYDLDDEDLQPYLDRSKCPEIWRLRRLSFEQREHVQYLLRKDQLEAAYFYAFLHGVVALEGVEDDAAGSHLAKMIGELPAKRLHKHEDALKTAIADYAMGVVDEVGAAVVQASMDLTEPEGKPSASPRGA